MIKLQLLLATLSGIALLLILVTRFKINAFISLLIASIFVGIAAGMPLSSVIESFQNGMGGTLGFVATVIGLGSILARSSNTLAGQKQWPNPCSKSLQRKMPHRL